MPNDRHSTAFDKLDTAAFAAYRALALDQKKRLADMEKFCGDRGVHVSASMAARDREWFRTQAEREARYAASVRAAESFVKAAGDSGGVAAMQAGAANLVTELMFDWLSRRDGTPSDDDIKDLAKIGHSLSDMARAQIAQFQAEVKRRAADAAAAVRKTISDTPGRLGQDILDKIDRAIFGIAGAKKTA